MRTLPAAFSGFPHRKKVYSIIYRYSLYGNRQSLFRETLYYFPPDRVKIVNCQAEQEKSNARKRTDLAAPRSIRLTSQHFFSQFHQREPMCPYGLSGRGLHFVGYANKGSESSIKLMNDLLLCLLLIEVYPISFMQRWKEY